MEDALARALDHAIMRVVEGDGSFFKLAHALACTTKALAAADESTHEQVRRVHETYRWHGDQMHRMPALVIVGVKGRYEDQPQIMQASAYGSILPAAWSFMLAARTKGLGATWTTLHLANAERVAEVLKLPDDFTQAVMLAVGFYKGETFKPAVRMPAASYIHRNGW